MITEYKYQLQPYKGPRTRHNCPQCGKAKEFTLYIDTETGQPLAPNVGKCNRESKCGYHYPPAQYFADNPQLGDGEAWKQSEAWKTVYQPPAPQPVEYLPREVMERTLKGYARNNFVKYLAKLFGREKALALAKLYYLGTSKRFQNDGGNSVVFWQIDRAGNVRQAKVMAYNPQTGKRIKEAGGRGKVAFMGKAVLKNQEANLQQCLFGEHLLSQEEGKPVALVESEKTAVIMAGIMPGAIWLATGGKHGARLFTEREVYKALEGRKVVLYPDLGAFNDWQDKAKILATVCSYQVSTLLEQKAQGQDKEEGFDVADYFIKALQKAPRIEQPANSPAGNATAQTESLPAEPQQSDIRPQEEPTPEPGPTTPQPEEQAPEGPGLAQEGILPPGFQVVERIGGNVLEVDGLPLEWLNEEEAAEAQERAKGYELEIFEQLNPDVSELVERFGLEVEEVLPAG